MIFFLLKKINLVEKNWDATEILSHLFLIKGDYVFWSISVEFKYYILSPFLLIIIHKHLHWNIRSTLIFLFILIVISLIVTIYFELPLDSFIRYLPIFLTGTILSLLEILKPDKFKKLTAKIIFNYIVIISILTIIILIPFYFKMIFGIKHDIRLPYYYCPYAILFSFLIVSVKYKDNLIKKVFELKALRFIGIISYSIYLFHMFFLELSIMIQVPDYLRIYIFFIITVIFCSVSYLTIEKQMAKIRLRDMVS